VRGVLKAALVLVPLLAIFLGIRWVSGREAERWRARVERYVPHAVVGVDDEDLLVIAGDVPEAQEAAARVRGFYRALADRYTDLLGKPRFDRLVVVVFPDVESLQAYAGAAGRVDRGAAGQLEGYADNLHGTLFIPRDEIDTLRHETVHWFMETARRAEAPGYSPWLSEGLAQLFETFDPDARPPGPPRVEGVRLPKGLDVDRLIRIDDYGRFLVEGPRNYAEARVLAGFLFATRPKELEAYVNVERRTEEGRPEAFERIFDVKGEAFRRDLQAFIARLR
jgi:hypothetical protein